MKVIITCVIKIFIFQLLSITNISAFQDFCSPLANSHADSRNAVWYPPSCNTDEKTRGSRCFLKCKEGYKLKIGSGMSVDCVNIGRATWSPIGLGNTCELNRFCPPLIGSRFSRCNKANIAPGFNCHPPNCHHSQNTIGPVEITCLQNGTWSTGGSYCEGIIATSIVCPKDTIHVETDPNTAYVDARVHVPEPHVTDINIAQVKAPQLENLNKSVHNLKFVFDADPSGKQKSCNIKITVTDKQKPMLYDCVEEEEVAARPGLTALINPAPCVFRDNVDGDINGVLKGVGGTGADGHDYHVGFYDKQRYYEAKDLSGNMLRSFPTYTVHEKSCRFRVAPIGVEVIQNQGTAIYLLKCANDSFRLYSAFSNPFRSAMDKSQLYFAWTCQSNFLFNGIAADCYEPLTMINGVCPNGSVQASSDTFCIPCARGFYFGTDNFGSKCELCPANHTTENIGSSTCTPCPENSRTIGGLRYCEYFCQLGEAYNGSSCEKCTFGTYGLPGASNCTKCSADTITIKERASSDADCLPGKIVTSSSGTVTATTTKDIPFYFVLDLNVPKNQINQNVGLVFSSSHLSTISGDCSEGYIQVIGMYDEFQTNLTDLLCGTELNKMHIIKLRPWRANYIKIYSKNMDSDIKVTYGHGVCSLGQYFNLTDGQCNNCSKGTYQDHRNSYSCKKCKDGMTNFADGQSVCVKPCPDGFNGDGILCIPCPMNTIGVNSMCIPCGNGNATEFTGSTQCTPACQVGEFKDDQGTCKKCPHGMYQSNQRHAQKVCFYCPKGLTTIIDGATSQSDCIAKEKCHYEGEFYNTKTGKCEKCPLSTYKVASGGNVGACTKCPDGLVTKKIGGIRKSDCQVNQTACEINNPCQFPGQCIEVNGNATCLCPKYYTGKFCEQVDGPCRDANCNNGTCVPYSETSIPYSCICNPGFTGRMCDTEHDPCDPNPCLYDGNCTISTPGKYKCSCPIYFGGQRCEKRLKTPCQNDSNCNPQGGECKLDLSVYGKFTCTCYQSYEGPACFKKIIPCEKNPCNETGTERCENRPSLKRHCVCKPGFKGEKCDQIEACTAGEFHYGKRCCKCIQGSYHQESTTVRNCTECPSGLSTYLRGSKDPRDCIDLTKKEYFQASVFITSTEFQGKEGKADKSGCGYLVDVFETKLKEEISKRMENSGDILGVHVESFHPPPNGKRGMIANITVYGNMENNEKAYKTVVKSGNISSYLVDENYLEIYKRHEGISDGGGGDGGDKKKTPLWLLILLPVVAALLIIIFVAYRMHKRNKRTTPVRSSLFNKEYGVSFAYTQEARVEPDGLDNESFTKSKEDH